MLVIPIRVDDNLGFKVDFNILKKDQAYWLNNIFAGGRPHGFIPINIRFDIYVASRGKVPYISLFPTTIITCNTGDIKIGLAYDSMPSVRNISNLDFDGSIDLLPSAFTTVSYNTNTSTTFILAGVVIKYSTGWDPNDPETWTISVLTSTSR